MKTLEQIKEMLEFIGGSRESAPVIEKSRYAPWLRGLWWGLLLGGIILFCGQTSKFIYIDF